jgi:hypothetical protein
MDLAFDDKLFQPRWWYLKGNYDLNSAFEKANRLLEQKRTGSQFYYIALCATNIIKTTCVGIYQKNYF